ncbi:MAG: MTH938/NDUFAF3 family protein [Deltaproteobacteria bacterium]
MQIDDYAYGRVRMGDKVYESDLIVYPDKVVEGWSRKEEERLSPTDIRDVLDFQPAMLIIGQGDSEVLELTPDMKVMLSRLGIDWVARPTGEAVLLFNEYQPIQKRTVGLFYLGP